MADFLVILHSSNETYQAVGVFEAEDGQDANGIAAISIQTGGKFTSFPLEEGTTTVTELTQSTESTPANFSNE